MKIVPIIAMICFFVGCDIFKYRRYDIYQSGIKIDSICVSQSIRRGYSDDGTYYKYVGECYRSK